LLSRILYLVHLYIAHLVCWVVRNIQRCTVWLKFTGNSSSRIYLLWNTTCVVKPLASGGRWSYAGLCIVKSNLLSSRHALSVSKQSLHSMPDCGVFSFWETRTNNKNSQIAHTVLCVKGGKLLSRVLFMFKLSFHSYHWWSGIKRGYSCRCKGPIRRVVRAPERSRKCSVHRCLSYCSSQIAAHVRTPPHTHTDMSCQERVPLIRILKSSATHDKLDGFRSQSALCS